MLTSAMKKLYSFHLVCFHFYYVVVFLHIKCSMCCIQPNCMLPMTKFFLTLVLLFHFHEALNVQLWQAKHFQLNFFPYFTYYYYFCLYFLLSFYADEQKCTLRVLFLVYVARNAIFVFIAVNFYVVAFTPC